MRQAARLGALVAAAWMALVAAGCNLGRQEARVECKNDPSIKGFTCTVKHTKGKKHINVCWDLVINCKGGTSVKANACQDVDPKGTATHKIAYSEFSGTCPKPTGVAVKHMKLSIE